VLECGTRLTTVALSERWRIVTSSGWFLLSMTMPGFVARATGSNGLRLYDVAVLRAPLVDFGSRQP
jgi:hypothetical protein